MRGRDPERVDRVDAVLRIRVVVVQHAECRHPPVPVVRLGAVWGAVSVEALSGDVAQEHVELLVGVVGRGVFGGVGDWLAVAERPGLVRPDVLERGERGLHLRRRGRLRHGGRAVVDTEVLGALARRRAQGDRVGVPVGHPATGEHLVRVPAIAARQLGPGQVEITQGHGDVGVDTVADGLVGTHPLGVRTQLALRLGKDVLRLRLGEGRRSGRDDPAWEASCWRSPYPCRGAGSDRARGG